MSKYSTVVQAAEFDQETRFCTVAGWLTIYNTDPVSREYIGASYEYVSIGIAPPPSVYTDEPKLPPAGKALRRTADGKAWEHVADHRGTIAYNTETRQQVTVTDIGDLPTTLTTSAPATEFDQWDGHKWVTDKEAQKQAAIDAATAKKSALLEVAEEMITPLQSAIDLEMATEEEAAQLKAWKKYQVLLNRVDVTKEVVEWPEQPTA